MKPLGQKMVRFLLIFKVRTGIRKKTYSKNLFEQEVYRRDFITNNVIVTDNYVSTHVQLVLVDGHSTLPCVLCVWCENDIT